MQAPAAAEKKRKMNALWTSAEDKLLASLLKSHFDSPTRADRIPWVEIAKNFPGRDSKFLSDKYSNALARQAKRQRTT